MHSNLSCWEVFQCLKKSQKEKSWAARMDACRSAAKVTGSCRDVLTDPRDLNCATTAFRNLATRLDTRSGRRRIGGVTAIRLKIGVQSSR